MAKIARILPIPVEFRPGVQSIQNSLAERGIFRYPGTKVGLVPIMENNGRFKTGLDWEAAYIDHIIDPAAKKAEIAKIKERYERLSKATRLDLNPIPKRGEEDFNYYSGVYGVNYNKPSVAHPIKLSGHENVFNFSDPFEEVTYWWVIQYNNLIASSLEAVNSGRCHKDVQFYVHNPEEEAGIIYKKKTAANKAIVALDAMSLDKRKKVARLIGLSIQDNDKEEIVYNQIDTFLKLPEIKIGEYQGQDPVALFNRMANMEAQLLEVSDLVNTAIQLRVYNLKGQIVCEGDSPIADTKAQLITSLCTEAKQRELLSLEARVNDKKKLKV